MLPAPGTGFDPGLCSDRSHGACVANGQISWHTLDKTQIPPAQRCMPFRLPAGLVTCWVGWAWEAWGAWDKWANGPSLMLLLAWGASCLPASSAPIPQYACLLPAVRAVLAACLPLQWLGMSWHDQAWPCPVLQCTAALHPRMQITHRTCMLLCCSLAGGAACQEG